MTPVQLPEVPAPVGFLLFHHHMGVNQVHGYTAAQLREYATEAVMAERERMIELATNAAQFSFPRLNNDGLTFAARMAAFVGYLKASIDPSETNSER